MPRGFRPGRAVVRAPRRGRRHVERLRVGEGPGAPGRGHEQGQAQRLAVEVRQRGRRLQVQEQMVPRTWQVS